MLCTQQLPLPEVPFGRSGVTVWLGLVWFICLFFNIDSSLALGMPCGCGWPWAPPPTSQELRTRVCATPPGSKNAFLKPITPGCKTDPLLSTWYWEVALPDGWAGGLPCGGALSFSASIRRVFCFIIQRWNWDYLCIYFLDCGWVRHQVCALVCGCHCSNDGCDGFKFIF